MTKPTRSWKRERDERRTENFVVRGDEVRVFVENFKGDTPQHMVFAVTGEGGVGKSTLLKRYRQLAESLPIHAHVALCDERQPSPVTAMGYIAHELAQHNITHKEFDERHKKYRELRQEVENDPKMSRGVVDMLALGLSDFTVKSLRGVLGVGVFAEHVDEKAAGEMLAQVVHYGISCWGNKDEVVLLREPERILTPLFVQLLNKACEQQRLVVLFDVFERTSGTLAPWLFSLFNFEHGEFDTRLTFVVSGRDALDQRWTELADFIAHVRLEPFKLEETRQYLANRNISAEPLVAQIHDDTGGLPVLVELLAATNPQPTMPLPDVSKDAVARFLQWTPQAEQRQVALLAAVPRQFNRDVLSAALGKDATKEFAWLATQSYVRTDSARGYFYHEKVRELMLRHLRQTTPNDLSATHARLAALFADAQVQLQLTDKAAYESEMWRKHECERVYHAVSVQPERYSSVGSNAFLEAFRWRWGFCEAIAKVCAQVGDEHRLFSVNQWAETLQAIYEGYGQDDFTRVVAELNRLETQPDLTLSARCGLFAKRGYSHRQKRQYDEAIADLTRALEIDPKDDWTLVSRGAAYRLKGQYDEAIADLTRALEINPKYAWALALRGEAYRQKGQYDEAIADLTRALEIDPKDTWALALRGGLYRQKGQYDEAIADLTRALELDPKDAFALALRGEAYRRKGQYDEAIADLTRALELNPKDVGALALRGEAYRLKGQYDEAIADLSRALEIEPDDAWDLAQRGEAYRRKGQYDEAVADLTRALEIEPDDAWDLAQRGAAYRQKGQYDEAIADLTRALEIEPDDAWDLAQRSEAYRRKGQYDEAIADLSRALEIDPKYAWALSSRGEAYRRKGQYDEAIADLTCALEIEPDDAWDLAQRGEAYRRKGQYDEAIADLSRALEIDPKYAWALSSRGEAYRRKGQYDEAIADLTRALEIDPKSDWRHYQLALVCIAKVQRDIARPHLEKAIALAQPRYTEKPDNWNNAFNLGVYCVALGDAQAEAIYEKAITQTPSLPFVKDAIRDLEDLLTVDKDNALAQVMLARLKGLS